MSAALPYLQKLKKSELTVFAETADLPDYEGLRKADLEVALDEHLRANQTTYAREGSLSEYYRRLGPRSPAKKVSDTIKNEIEPVVKKVRRKTQTQTRPIADLLSSATSDMEGTVQSLVKTPARELASMAQSVPLPASPADVTNAIEIQSRKFSASVSKVYRQSGITQHSDSVRDVLSSPLAINVIALIVEAYGLRQKILPGAFRFNIPAKMSFNQQPTPVYFPILTNLFDPSFLKPFSLWSLTSLLIPLAFAYFINIPLKTLPGHNVATRRATSIKNTPSLQFDPVVFNIAKALMAYLVYAQHFDLLGLFQNYTIATVNEGVLGGYTGMMTGAGIAGLIALYEAVLKK